MIMMDIHLPYLSPALDGAFEETLHSLSPPPDDEPHSPPLFLYGVVPFYAYSVDVYHMESLWRFITPLP